MTPIQWGPSPPEPESYSATSTGTPAPLSPDVAELVRRVRQVDYAEDAGGYLLKDEVNQLADACERLAAENAKLRERAEKAEKERDAIAKRQRSDEDQLCRIAVMLSKDARHSNDGTIAGLVDALMTERDAALAKCREMEEHINRASGVVQ